MRYITLQESIRLNGDRHKLRSLLHSIMGRYDYAAGSSLKMIKNYKRSDSLRNFGRRGMT